MLPLYLVVYFSIKTICISLEECCQVVSVNELVDAFAPRTGETAPGQGLPLEDGKPYLHLIKPEYMGRREWKWTSSIKRHDLYV